MRVIEYHVLLDGATTPELFCLVTDLLDHHTHPAHQLAGAYRWRWDGSETALREAKSAIHDAGPGTGAILRSASPELIRQEHAAWIVGTELVRAATRSAAAIAAPFRKGPRTGQAVAARHLSFTTARRALIGTVRAGTATASLPAPARAAAPPPRPGRDRHRPGHHRPAPPPRPQGQNQAAVPARTPRHHHPHRPRPRARLRHYRGLTPHPRVPRSGLPRARNPAHPARQPGRRHPPRPLSLSVHHSKITTRVRGSANYLISLALARRPSRPRRGRGRRAVRRNRWRTACTRRCRTSGGNRAAAAAALRCPARRGAAAHCRR